MRLSEYQEKASRTMRKDLSDGETTLHALHGLSAEAGEIHSIYQKMFQGHKFDEEHLKKEIGDLLWMLAELCTANWLSLEEIAEMNIEKLQKRYPNGFEAEKSINRKEGDI